MIDHKICIYEFAHDDISGYESAMLFDFGIPYHIDHISARPICVSVEYCIQTKQMKLAFVWTVCLDMPTCSW